MFVTFLVFYEVNFFNRYKTSNVSVSSTGKQQFYCQPEHIIIYQLSDNDRSVPDDIDV